MAEVEGDAVTDEILAVFERHGIIGVVSFVKLTQVTTVGDQCNYKIEGEATVITPPDQAEHCVVAALEHLHEHQTEVTNLIEKCRRDAQKIVSRFRSLN